jgi:hypothetical protein
MSGPFSSVGSNGQPQWTNLPPDAGNFTTVNVLGSSYQEVGYGQGGYGEDGYDTPSQTAQGAPQPIWTTGSTE